MKGITLQEMSDDTVQQLQANYVRQPAFAHTEGTAEAYTVILDPKPTSLEDGFGITIIPHVTNEAEVTLNINGLGAISLKDQKGKAFTSGKLQAGKPYTFRKVGTDFLADSSGGSGDAVSGDIRAGKVATTDDGEIVGTMPTHSDVFKAGSYFNDLHNTFLDSEVAIDSGYYPENTKVRIQINDSNFKSENIRSGITLFGEEGTLTGYNPVIKNITQSPIEINQPANSTLLMPLVNLGSNNGLLQLINGNISIPESSGNAVISITSNADLDTSIYLTNSASSITNGELLISATYGAGAYLLACNIDYVRRKYSTYAPKQEYNETNLNANLSMHSPSYLVWYGRNSSGTSRNLYANIRGQLSTISM